MRRVLISIIVSVGILGVALLVPTLQPETPPVALEPATEPVEEEGIKEPELPDLKELYRLTNLERTDRGLNALIVDPRLEASASAKCNDMVARDYWSHNTPDGIEPWAFFSSQGITWEEAGENLAYRYTKVAPAWELYDIQPVVYDWMNSATHRAELLRKEFTHTGLAQCISPNYLNKGSMAVVVQHFLNP